MYAHVSISDPQHNRMHYSRSIIYILRLDVNAEGHVVHVTKKKKHSDISDIDKKLHTKTYIARCPRKNPRGKPLLERRRSAASRVKKIRTHADILPYISFY